MAPNNINNLAVVSQSGETLTFYSLTTGAVIDQLTKLTAEPHELCFDSRTNLLYTSHAYSHGWNTAHGDFGHTISVIDCNPDQPKRSVTDVIDISPAQGPDYLALDAQREILYASVEGGLGTEGSPIAGGIIGIDLHTKKVVKQIESGTQSIPCNKEAEFVSVFDLLEGKLVCKIDMPGGCEQPGITSDGSLAYFPSPTVAVGMAPGAPSPSIKVVDTTQNVVVHDIPLDRGALICYVDVLGRLLIGQYWFDPALKATKLIPLTGRLKVLSSKDDEYCELGAVETGGAPLTLLRSTDGKRAFAANILEGTMTVVNMENLSIERTLEIDTVPREDKKLHQGAHGLALVP